MSEQGRDAVMAALTAMRDRPDSTPLLPHIQVPALVVVGAADVVTPPPAAEAMAAALPDARLRVIAGAGHLANLEAPDEFSRALGELLDELA